MPEVPGDYSYSTHSTNIHTAPSEQEKSDNEKKKRSFGRRIIENIWC